MSTKKTTTSTAALADAASSFIAANARAPRTDGKPHKKTPVKKSKRSSKRAVGRKGKKPAVKAAPKRATKRTDRNPRLPEPGSTFTRTFKGRDLTIKVLDGGAFEYEGARYSSLSSLARKITNYSVSGPLFFRVVERMPAKATGK